MIWRCRPLPNAARRPSFAATAEIIDARPAAPATRKLLETRHRVAQSGQSWHYGDDTQHGPVQIADGPRLALGSAADPNLA